jgi:hypothetical protein
MDDAEREHPASERPTVSVGIEVSLEASLPGLGIASSSERRETS